MQRMPVQIRFCIMVLLGIILVSCVAKSEAAVSVEAERIGQAAEVPVAPKDEGLIRNFSSEVSCSETILRRGTAFLFWEVDKEVVKDVRVDLTVYKGGFEKNLFTSFFPDKEAVKGEDERFRPPASSPLLDGPAIIFRDLPIVRTQQGRQRQELASDLIVEALEPGVNHFWRIVVLTGDGEVRSETVRNMAPVCPADIVDGKRGR